MSIPQLHLKRGKAGPAIGHHPWVKPEAVDRIEGDPQAGDEVAIHESDGRFLAYGFFNPKSHIRARLYSWDENTRITPEFLRKKIEEALSLRARLNLADPKSGARIVFSEGDGLSGLIVDRYRNYLSLQITSLGILKRREAIVSALVDLVKPAGIFFKSSKDLLRWEGVEAEDEILYGKIPDELIDVEENGVKYLVDLKHSQKTGLYFDQRNNRALVQKLARDKSVLDLYCYTGGFALAAAKGGAKEVVGVDSSEIAIETARGNLVANDFKGISFHSADVFDFIREGEGKVTADKTFDMVIVDPPKLAPSKASKQKSLKTYFRLNEEALTKVKPNGIFVTGSCSQQISFFDLSSIISAVGRRAGRNIRILEQRLQAPDHPVNAFCPESLYLKAIVCYVT